QGNIIRSPSDKRLKEDIKSVKQPLQKVVELDGVTYGWKDENRFGPDRNIGLLAQEVNETVPQAVETGGEYMSVNYNNITALLVEAVKKQQEKIESISTGKQIQGSTSNMENDRIGLASSSEFGKIKVEGHTTFGEDTVGEAVVKRGYKKVNVDFENKYGQQPIVTANQMGSPIDGLNYSVKDVSTAGFTIVLNDRYEKDIKFSWHAFAAGEESKVHLSGGTTSTLEINVEEIKGCTDPEAENYDPNATKDDGSCKIPGCIDVKADNYDPNATIGDGSCSYSESKDKEGGNKDKNSDNTSSASDNTSSTKSNKDQTSENTTTSTDKTNSTQTTSSTDKNQSSDQDTTTSTTKQQSDKKDNKENQNSTTSTKQTESNSNNKVTDTNPTSSDKKTVEKKDKDSGGSSSNTSTTKTDATKPEISMNGPKSITIDRGTEYVDKGATASDNIDGDLTDQIKTSNNVDTSKPGSYSVEYKVKDQAGNESVKVREVIVEKVVQDTKDNSTTTQKTTTGQTDTTSTSTSS
ncbi:MAG: immunoglobulin-like domain-containing protein, partial [Candidatus Paceibacteria bacterium]